MKKTYTANKAETLINKHRRLKPLLANARNVMQIDYLLKLYLKEPIRSKVQVSYYNQKKVVVYVDSAAWATQFRYQIPSLLKQLRQHPEMASLRFIEWKIQSEPLKVENKPRKAIPISASNADMLKTTAESMDDQGLKNALLKLSKHGKTQDNR